MRFETQSGSFYEIDEWHLKFRRYKATDVSGHIRSVDGEGDWIKFNSHTTVKVGLGVHFFCDPINPLADFRDVYTSDVTRIIHGKS